MEDEVGMAIKAYLYDYDPKFPMSLYLTTSGTNPCLFTVYHAILPHLNNVQSTDCPAEPRALDVAVGLQPIAPLCPSNFRYTGYIGNWCVIENGRVPGFLNPNPPVSQAELDFISETSLRYDGTLGPIPLGIPS